MAFCIDRFVVLCFVCLAVTVRWARVSVFSFCMVIPVKISLAKHSQINTYYTIVQYTICVTALKFNFVLIRCLELSFVTGQKTHFYLSPKGRNWFFLCFVNGETLRFLYVPPIGRNILYHLLIS